MTIQIKPFLAELSDGAVVFQHFTKTLDGQITGYDVIVDSNLHSASYRFYSSYDVPFLP